MGHMITIGQAVESEQGPQKQQLLEDSGDNNRVFQEWFLIHSLDVPP